MKLTQRGDTQPWVGRTSDCRRLHMPLAPLAKAKVGPNDDTGGMKTLVTGATGLLGGWIARKLLDGGHAVRVLVRDEQRLPADLKGRVEVAKGDVSEPATLGVALAGVEVVFHSAGIPEQIVRDETIFDRVNHLGTVNMLSAAKAAGVRRFVHTSTMDTLEADAAHVVREGQRATAPKPTPYERSKVAAEVAVRAAADAGLDAVWIHPAAIYGPGATPTMLTGTIAKLLTGELPMLPPGGMSVSYVESLAAAHVAAAERGERGQGYLVADAHVTPLALAQAVAAQVLGVRVPSVGPAWLLMAVAKVTTPVLTALGRAPLADAGQLHWLFADTRVDSSKATQQLGFSPTPVAEGLARTIADLQKRFPVSGGTTASR
jgi:nucleoside-diphosphate-sugar epimerase